MSKAKFPNKEIRDKAAALCCAEIESELALRAIPLAAEARFAAVDAQNKARLEYQEALSRALPELQAAPSDSGTSWAVKEPSDE